MRMIIFFTFIIFVYSRQSPCIPPGVEEKEWTVAKCFEDLYYKELKYSHELRNQILDFKNNWIGTFYCYIYECLEVRPFF